MSSEEDACGPHPCQDVPVKGKPGQWLRVHFGDCPQRPAQQETIERMRKALAQREERAAKRAAPGSRTVVLPRDVWAVAYDVVSEQYVAAEDADPEVRELMKRFCVEVGKVLR